MSMTKQLYAAVGKAVLDILRAKGNVYLDSKQETDDGAAYSLGFYDKNEWGVEVTGNVSPDLFLNQVVEFSKLSHAEHAALLDKREEEQS